MRIVKCVVVRIAGLPVNEEHWTSQLLSMVNRLCCLSIVVLLININGPNKLFQPLYSFDNLLEVTAMCNIIDRASELLDLLGIADDLIEVIGMLNTMTIDRANQVLQFFRMADDIL